MFIFRILGSFLIAITFLFSVSIYTMDTDGVEGTDWISTGTGTGK